MLKSTKLQIREEEKKIRILTSKNISKGLTLSIIIILVISGSSQLDLSSGKSQRNRSYLAHVGPGPAATLCRRSSGPPKSFKSANNNSCARGTNCMNTLQATRELFWLQREGAASVWREARGSAGFRLENQVQESSWIAPTHPWKLGTWDICV